MERFELENSREFKAAQELEDALNNMSWNSELRSQWCIITGYSNKTQEYKRENWHYSDYDEEYMNMQKT